MATKVRRVNTARGSRSEVVLDRIEQGSKCPWPKQANHSLFDPELLPTVFDPDDVAHEASIERHFKAAFTEPEDVHADQDDFRDRLDACACGCDGECVCIQGCTERDLRALSSEGHWMGVFNHRTRLVFDHFEEVFDLVLPWDTALRCGFVSQ